ncbi:PQQ-binding-like beta-propeller repeat protein, partial [Actinotalea ferrariae]|uniref:outer membrane protein assembly factor BamB family protein n=1 Tax=Actinotalea ferrariae TaxID=1386098 RepID=UPI0005531723
RRRPGLVVGAALVLVAGLVALNAVEQRRLAARVAAYAAVPGTVPTLDAPLDEAWSERGEQVSRAGHLVLLTDRDGTTVRAVDATSGAQVWSLERGGAAPVQRCLADREAERAPVVVCARGRSDGGPPGTVTRVVLDAADGTVLRQHPAHLASHGQAVTGSDVVSAEMGEDGSLVVVRSRAVDRATVWATRVPLGGGRQAGSGAGVLRVENGFVVLGGSTTAVLDVADGRVLGTWYPGGYTAAGSVPGLDGADIRTAADGFGAWSDAAAGARGASGTWFDRSGDPVGALDGVLVEADVSDGSLPDVRLSARGDTGELVATDLAAGAELWRAPARGTHLLVRRAGVVVVAAGEEVRALDLRSGAVRWAAPVRGLVATSGSVTDGATVVVVAESRGSARLVAVDLDSGALRWEVPAPGIAPLSERRHDFPHVALGEVAGRPVLLGDGVVVGLS